MYTHAFSSLTSKKKMLIWQLAILALMQLINYFVAASWWSVLWLVVGGLIGLAMLKVDEHYLHNYYRSDDQDTRLITRSPLFVTVFAAVALLVLTSSDQYVGFGVVFGLAIGLLVEGWMLSSRIDDFAHYFSLYPPRHATNTSVQNDSADVDTNSVSQPSISPLSQVAVFRIMTGATVYMLLVFGWWVISQL